MPRPMAHARWDWRNVRLGSASDILDVVRDDRFWVKADFRGSAQDVRKQPRLLKNSVENVAVS